MPNCKTIIKTLIFFSAITLSAHFIYGQSERATPTLKLRSTAKLSLPLVVNFDSSDEVAVNKPFIVTATVKVLADLDNVTSAWDIDQKHVQILSQEKLPAKLEAGRAYRVRVELIQDSLEDRVLVLIIGNQTDGINHQIPFYYQTRRQKELDKVAKGIYKRNLEYQETLRTEE